MSLQLSNHLNANRIWFAVSLIWAGVIIVPLIYFPIPQNPMGHPWKVELAFSLFLTFCLGYWLLSEKNLIKGICFQSHSKIWFVYPILAFTLWSAFSAIWANSGSSVLHHTLLWFCYAAFVCVVSLIIKDRKYLKNSIISVSILIGTISLICIAEYSFSPNISETFGFRYGRYAEIFATLLPFFFAYTLRSKRRHLAWSVSITLLLTLALLFSLSRAAFASALIGVAVFVILRCWSKPIKLEILRAAVMAFLMILVGFGSQVLPFSSQEKGSAITRLKQQNDNDASNSLTQNVRFLIWSVGREMFVKNKLLGVGADNFGLEFNRYRAYFVEKPENKSESMQGEDAIPERTHNEFIQVFSELGIIGGLIFLILIIGIMKLGLTEIFQNRRNRSNILTQAAFAGVIVFLVSSCFSSFSFRLMQNGIVFFFLIAVLLRNKMFEKTEATDFRLDNAKPKIILILAILACVSLTIYSTVRATSQYLTNSAENTTDFETSRSLFEKAMWLDSSNASAQFSFGLKLLNQKRFDDSSIYFQKAIDNGMGASSAYFILALSQSLGNDEAGAKKTLEEALKLYPYSYFLHLRYARLLKNSDAETSQKHRAIAKEINPKQSETWWIFLNEGAKVAFEKTKNNKDAVPFTDLIPNQAVNTVIFERQILDPNEKISFGFMK